MAARASAAVKAITEEQAPAQVVAERVANVDQLIHERIRLGIVSALAVNESLTFKDLRNGNLSVHAKKLEEAGYLSCRKSFASRVPKTEYRLTPKGRKMFEKYLDHMEALIGAMREHAK